MGQPHLVSIRLSGWMGSERYGCDGESGATTGINNVVTAVIVSAHSSLRQSRHYTPHLTETIRNPLNRMLRPAQPEVETIRNPLNRKVRNDRVSFAMMTAHFILWDKNTGENNLGVRFLHGSYHLTAYCFMLFSHNPRM